MVPVVMAVPPGGRAKGQPLPQSVESATLPLGKFGAAAVSLEWGDEPPWNTRLRSSQEGRAASDSEGLTPLVGPVP